MYASHVSAHRLRYEMCYRMRCLMLEPHFKGIVRKPANSQAVKVSGLSLDPYKRQMHTCQISHLLTQLMMTSQSLDPPVVHREARRPQCPGLLKVHDGRVVPVFWILANINILQLCFYATADRLPELFASCNEADGTSCLLTTDNTQFDHVFWQRCGLA